MEEAFPIQFCKGIRSYWGRRKYRRLSGAATTTNKIRLGGSRHSPSSWTACRFRKLRPSIKFRLRLRLRLPSPAGLLRRLRDAYVNAMLGLAGKGPTLSGPDGLLARRVPKAKSRSVQSQPGEFEQRLILEIYKSVIASNKLGAAEIVDLD